MALTTRESSCSYCSYSTGAHAGVDTTGVDPLTAFAHVLFDYSIRMAVYCYPGLETTVFTKSCGQAAKLRVLSKLANTRSVTERQTDSRTEKTNKRVGRNQKGDSKGQHKRQHEKAEEEDTHLLQVCVGVGQRWRQREADVSHVGVCHRYYHSIPLTRCTNERMNE